MITEQDEAKIDRWFDRVTLARGRAYAADGAVLASRWAADGSLVEGLVGGSRAQPYEVTVHLGRGPRNELVSIDAGCSCPVGVDCKHAVALLLAPAAQRWGAAGGEPRPARPNATPTGPAWERRLGALMESGQAGAVRDEFVAVAIQFELVGAGLSGGWSSGGGQAAPRIRVRPVVQGNKGGWVRTGISWRNIDSLRYTWHRPTASVAQVALLREILALANLSSSRRYYSSDDAVWLESISSRRIWDLFDEAQGLGIPLVCAGREGAPAVVHRADAVPVLDASTGAKGITLRPLLEVEGAEVPFPDGPWLAVGDPPHGIAWLEQLPGHQAPSLSFARLSDRFATGPHQLLEAAGTITVPPAGQERFFSQIYPRLARQVEVRSTDGTVTLPEIPDQALILRVSHLEGHHVDLGWFTGFPGDPMAQPLGDPARHGYEPHLREALDEARRVVLGHAVREVLAPFGDRIEPEATLSGMGSVRFLSDVLPEIEAIPGVMVEHSGEPADYRQALDPPVVSLSGSGPVGDWFDLTVEVHVGGEEVPFRDLFMALAGGETHLILPSGTWFSLEADELRRLAELIAEARALQDADGDRIRVSRFQASLWEDFKRLGVLTAQATEWERSVALLAEAANRPTYLLPSGLTATLRPYQKVGFEWLAFLYELGLGGILADDMGLGKTVQALALVCHVREQELSGAPFLVVAPTSVVANWAAECRKFAPGLRVETVKATAVRRDRTLFDLAATADVVVTSYALFRLEYDDYEKVEWAGLFLDEAQFVKNVHSRAYQRAKTFPAPFKVAITGTPMENHLLELWSLLSITAAGLFGSAERFTEFYRTPIERGSGDARAERLELLRRRTRPLMLRRTKELVASDLPDKQEQVIELDLHPRHAKLYQTYLQRERQKVLGLLTDLQKNRFEILKSLTLLRQASLDMSLVDPKHAKVPSTKLDALDEMLEEIVADGHRVLVFSQFTRFLTLARNRVKAAGIPHCYLDGRTRRRDEVLAEFRSGEVPVFLVSLKAGGFGLNLTEADYCILLDPWWNPATEAQAVDRAHRIGQTKKVMVYRLVAKDTVEEKVMALKARKAALFASVLDGGGFESGAMSTADIRELLE
jgi:superfamily II DNA or RNA helicase